MTTSSLTNPNPKREGETLTPAGRKLFRALDESDQLFSASNAQVNAAASALASARPSPGDPAAKALPDFWMSSGLCSMTGHASIGPDYNGPAGERLRAEWPEADFHSGFHADIAPGDGPHRECFAILSCMLQAMLARALLQQSGTASAARSFVEKSVKEAGQ
ncbi:hypothetical protein [Methylobacterium sp. CM6244]